MAQLYSLYLRGNKLAFTSVIGRVIVQNPLIIACAVILCTYQRSYINFYIASKYYISNAQSITSRTELLASYLMLLDYNPFNLHNASATLMALPALSTRYTLNYSSLLRITLRILTFYIRGIPFPLNQSGVVVSLPTSLYLVKQINNIFFALNQAPLVLSYFLNISIISPQIICVFSSALRPIIYTKQLLIKAIELLFLGILYIKSILKNRKSIRASINLYRRPAYRSAYTSNVYLLTRIQA